MFPVRFLVKGHVDHSARGERGGERRHRPESEEDIKPLREGAAEDLALPPPGEEGEGHQSHRAQQEQLVRERDGLSEPTHLAHVRPAVQVMQDGRRREEQERLEEGVRRQVEDRHRIGPEAAGQEHQAELSGRRVGQEALDVGLHQTDHGAEQGGRRPNDGDYQQRVRGPIVDVVAAGYHVNAGRHHGRSVDQGAGGRGSFHGAGQPRDERQLSRLADGPEQQAQADGGEGPGVDRPGPGEDLRIVGRLKAGEDQEDPQQEARVADTVHDESLRAGLRRRRPFVVIADEQVRADAHALPPQKEEDVVVRHHQHQHGEDEQGHDCEEAREAPLVVHVVDGENRDQETDARGHEHHDHG